MVISVGLRIIWWVSAQLLDTLSARLRVGSPDVTNSTSNARSGSIQKALVSIITAAIEPLSVLISFLGLGFVIQFVPGFRQLPGLVSLVLSLVIITVLYTVLTYAGKRLRQRVLPLITQGTRNTDASQTEQPIGQLFTEQDAKRLTDPLQTPAKPPVAYSGSSLIARTQMRMFVIFIVLSALSFAFSLGVGQLVRNQGMDSKTIQNFTTGALFISFFGSVFIIMPLVLRVLQPVTPLTGLLEAVMKAIQSTDYEPALARVEQARLIQDNWETQVPAILIYAATGRVDEVERLGRDVLRQLSEASSDTEREMNRDLMGNVSGAMAETFFRAERLPDADTVVQNALALQSDNFAVHNTAARIALYQNDIPKGELHLQAAVRAYKAKRQPPSFSHRTLQAWLMFIKGDYERGEQLFSDLAKELKPEKVADSAEYYMVRGFAARAVRKPGDARDAFRRAVELDPKGLMGIAGRRALET